MEKISLIFSKRAVFVDHEVAIVLHQFLGTPPRVRMNKPDVISFLLCMGCLLGLYANCGLKMTFDLDIHHDTIGGANVFFNRCKIAGEIPKFCCLIASIRLMILLGITGCAVVGPEYIPPDSKPPADWHADIEKGLVKSPLAPESLASWWTELGDPVLSSLIFRATEGNLDLASAKSKLREARARRGLAEAGLYPQIDATGSMSQSRGSGNVGSGRESWLYAAGFDAGWELDIFGGVRRAIEAADAEMAAGGEDLLNVLVSLTAESALNYIDVRTIQGRIAVAERNIAAQAETLSLVQSRFEAGLGDVLAVQQAKYNLESSRSQLPTLRSDLDAAKNRLAILVGSPPGAVHLELSEIKPIPVPPLSVAVGVPAEMLRQRPDVRGAERRLASQSAQVGVAMAELYPKFRLSGSIGLESLSASQLFEAESRTWRIGPSVSWRIFDAGAVRKNIAVQTTLQEQALIQYEITILNALEEVESAISAFSEEQRRRESLILAVEAAKLALSLSWDRYMAGVADFSNVLDAQRSLLSFEDSLIRSAGTVTSNLVRLYKSLGGGWRVLHEEEINEANIRGGVK